MALHLDEQPGPGGRYRFAVSQLGLLCVELPHAKASKRAFERHVADLARLRPRVDKPCEPVVVAEKVAMQLGAWDIDSAWESFHLPLPLDLRGTSFRVRVWQTLTKLPPGETETYAQLAERAGAPGAARAVGSAMRLNPIPLFVPCHRVLSSNGPGGFGNAGLGLKAKLLALEGVQLDVGKVSRARPRSARATR